MGQPRSAIELVREYTVTVALTHKGEAVYTSEPSIVGKARKQVYLDDAPSVGLTILYGSTLLRVDSVSCVVLSEGGGELNCRYSASAITTEPFNETLDVPVNSSEPELTTVNLETLQKLIKTQCDPAGWEYVPLVKTVDVGGW